MTELLAAIGVAFVALFLIAVGSMSEAIDIRQACNEQGYFTSNGTVYVCTPDTKYRVP